MVVLIAQGSVSPPVTPLKTPSKDAAARLDKFSIESPVKKMKPLVKEAEEESEKAPEELDLEELRKRFVGDIDLPESEEPLLKESKRRFVLFPIQYNEVSIHPLTSEDFSPKIRSG